MFFKSSILLLSIILVANTALGKSDDEILKESYNVCKRWANKTENELVSLNEFWLFMGKNSSDRLKIMTYFDNSNIIQAIINFFLRRNETRGLDLNDFCILFKEVCQERNVDVQLWAASRIDFAEKRTIAETILLQPAQTEDGAPTIKFALNDYEREILKKSFDDCRRWVTPKDKPVDGNIGVGEFCCYMGLSNKDTVLSGFFLTNLDAFNRMNGNYNANPDVAQGPIDVVLYSEMFKYICDKHYADVKQVADFRAAQAARRTLKEFCMLPHDQRD